MSRQSSLNREALKRRRVERDAPIDERGSRASDLGIGRFVASSTIASIASSWQSVAGNRADALQFSETPRLQIVTDEELNNVWGVSDEGARNRKLDTFLAKLISRGLISSNTADIAVPILDPRQLLSINDDGQLVATFPDLSENQQLSSENAAVRDALGLDALETGLVDGEFQIVFATAPDYENVSTAGRVDLKRVGSLVTSGVSFTPIGAVPVDPTFGQ